MDPLISIIVPTYNRAPLLAEALASVRAQTFGDWECLVIDDGSTDHTPAFLGTLDEPRLRLLRAEHSGNPARVRNLGIAVARGRYLAFLDDDDLWEPMKLASQVRLLQEGGCRWSYTGYVRLDAGGNRIWQSTPEWIRGGSILEPLLDVKVAVAMPTVMAERALVEEVGRFDEAARTREDYSLWLDLAARAEVGVIQEHLAVVRDHPGRVFRPWGYRFSVILYRKWLGRLTDPRLRRLCRRRIVDTYLGEARRLIDAGQWGPALPAIVQALPWDPRHAVRRLARGLKRLATSANIRSR